MPAITVYRAKIPAKSRIPDPPRPFASWDGAVGSASRGAAFNASAYEALPANLIRTINGDNWNALFSGSGVTISAITGYLRAVSTNTTGQVQYPANNLPAGTYTFSLDVKSHDGTSTYSIFVGTNGATAVTRSVTPTEATISFTFTIGSTTNVTLYVLYRNTTGDAYDIDFRNVRMHAGSSDLGVEAGSMHMRFGRTETDSSNPTFSDKTLGRQYGMALLPASKVITGYTFVAAINQAGNTGGTPAAALCGDSYTQFLFGTQNENVAVRINGNNLAATYGRVKQGNWIIIAARGGVNFQELYINGTIVYSGTNTFSSYTLTQLSTGILGGLGGGQFPSGDKVKIVQFFDRMLSYKELTAVILDQRRRVVADGLTLATIKTSVHAGGDSLTASAGSYAIRYFTTTTPLAVGEIFAVNSTGIDDCVSRINAREDAIRMAVACGTVPVYTILTGVNDTVDTTTWLPKYLYACKIIRNAGGKVLAIPVPPKGVTASAHNVARAPVNVAMAAAVGAYDGIVDVSALAAYDDAAPSGGVYYNGDQIHWNSAGYDNITATIDTARQAIIDSVPTPA